MSTRHRIIAALSAVLVASACADISPPTRNNRYDWQLPGLMLTFNWPEGHTVRVWVQDTLNLPAHAQAGIDTWKDQFLYREYNAELVSDSSTADVLVGITIPPASSQGVRLASMAPECSGETTFPPLAGSTIVLPFHVRITPRVLDPEAPAGQACFALTVTHELGHTMGLFSHSSDPLDLMFTDPVTGPSARDRNTVQVLYHVTPDLTASR